MKKCPFCAETILDDALKCRWCGEFMMKTVPALWYFKISFIIGLFCCVGPLALPLVWLHPRYSLKTKLIVSAVTLALTYVLAVVLTGSIKNILQYYQSMDLAG